MAELKAYKKKQMNKLVKPEREEYVLTLKNIGTIPADDIIEEAAGHCRLQKGNRGNKSPLKEMKRTFTLAEFAVKCQELKCKCAPNTIIRKYKQRGVIAENGNVFTINPEFCRKWGIAE